MSATLPTPQPTRWQRLSAASVRAFHTYGNWLVGISWWRFFGLAILLLIASAILQSALPSWKTVEVIDDRGSHSLPKIPEPPAPPKPPKRTIRIDGPDSPEAPPPKGGISIKIDENGVRITPDRRAGSAAPAASGAASSPIPGSVEIKLPPGAASSDVLEAVAEAKREIERALEEARREAADAAREAADAVRDAEAEARGGTRIVTHSYGVENLFPNLAFFWILASAILKITYKRQVQAEIQAAVATETAEAESLKRQVVEARMAAMQAQVEPHFLFNTLASIDHLIETDPARASQMQKHLIALLRAAMPTMREANAEGVRDLGRELAVIRPYLEILKVRMEERLVTDIRVPEGLHSAEFPPMMLQSLVENAIKHGLEPKPEGGSLSVSAEIVHGKLAVTVADTGLGFGKAATAGSGIGLANIRERLQLLYGSKASVTVAENTPSGTVVTITVPYTARMSEGASA
jgi:hypothetical protein